MPYSYTKHFNDYRRDRRKTLPKRNIYPTIINPISGNLITLEWEGQRHRLAKEVEIFRYKQAMIKKLIEVYKKEVIRLSKIIDQPLYICTDDNSRHAGSQKFWQHASKMKESLSSHIKKREAKAIVHAHSPHATAVSTHGKAIPAFHYMVALAGGEDIKCAEYATFGTPDLSINIIKALEKRKGCLMSNHGQLTIGGTLKQAFELAQEVENICHQYIIALKLGQPKILSSTEMSKILDKIIHYKKG